MGEWTDSSSSDGSADEAPKRKRLTLCKKLKQKENRWEFVNAAKEEALSLKFVPKNTSTNTKWALTNFTSWRDSRNTRFVGDSKNLVPSAILKTTDAAVLSRWFALYAAETRKNDGSRYPPKTIYSLLAGILRHMRSLNPACLNFLDTSDASFSALHNALDNVFRELRT